MFTPHWEYIRLQSCQPFSLIGFVSARRPLTALQILHSIHIENDNIRVREIIDLKRVIQAESFPDHKKQLLKLKIMEIFQKRQLVAQT